MCASGCEVWGAAHTSADCDPVGPHDGGTAWGDLRDEMPKIARAEAKAKAKQVWELIYKLGATLNGNGPLKLHLGPLALISLDTPSLNPPCYNGSDDGVPPRLVSIAGLE